MNHASPKVILNLLLVFSLLGMPNLARADNPDESLSVLGTLQYDEYGPEDVWEMDSQYLVIDVPDPEEIETLPGETGLATLNTLCLPIGLFGAGGILLFGALVGIVLLVRAQRNR
jgi:hypothetical protein